MQLQLFILYCRFLMASQNRTQGVFLFVVALSPFDFTFPLRRNPAAWTTFIICFGSHQQQPESEKVRKRRLLQFQNFPRTLCKALIFNRSHVKRRKFQICANLGEKYFRLFGKRWRSNWAHLHCGNETLKPGGLEINWWKFWEFRK